MRARQRFGGILAALALLAACGAPPPDPTTVTRSSWDPGAEAPLTTGTADLSTVPADQLQAQAAQALRSAASVQVHRGVPAQDGWLNLEVSPEQGGRSREQIAGEVRETRVIADDVWVLADVPYWRGHGWGNLSSQRMAGHWVHTTRTDPSVAQDLPSRRLDDLVDRLAGLDGLTLNGPTTLAGVSVLQLSNPAGEILLVSQQGQPRPLQVELIGPDGGRSRVTFEYRDPVGVGAPSQDVVELNDLRHT